MVPLWLAAIIAGGLMWLSWLVVPRVIRRHLRLAEGLCISCGYDLTGNVSGMCPECGTDNTESGQGA